jgi:hypothetical protein
MFKIANLYPITAVMLIVGGIIGGSQVAQAAPVVDCPSQWNTMQTAKTVPADMTEAVFLKSCKAKEAAAMKKPVIMKDKKTDEVVAAEKPTEAVGVKPDAKPKTMASMDAKPKVKKLRKKLMAPVEAVKPNDVKAPTEAADSVAPKTADKTMVEAKPAVKMKKIKKVAAPIEAVKAVTMSKPEVPAAAAGTKAVAMKKPAKKMAEPVSKVNEKPMDEKGMQQVRVTECGNQWKTMKIANKVPTGVTWPKFWLDCSGKMKAAGK